MGIFKKDVLSLVQTDVAPRHTVLLVDDEPDNLNVLTSIMSPHYHILKAGDGQEALDLVRKLERPEDIAMVVSDQRMPRMTGVQLCEQLCEILPKTVRVIVTGYIDVDAIIDSVNRARIYKFIIKPFDRHDFELTIQRAIESHDMQAEIDNYTRGLEQLVETRTQELQNRNQELLDAYKKLELMTYTDALTGLHNRHFMQSQIDKDISLCLRQHREAHSRDRDASSLLFILLDCDHFKYVNDHYGHDAGDTVLQQIADILRSIFRESDYIVRWGGEEFLIVARDSQPAHLPPLLERLRTTFAEHVFTLPDKKTLRRTVSIGAIVFPFMAHDAPELNWPMAVKLADTALYAAKYSGRNAWVILCAQANTMSLYDVIHSPQQAIENGSWTCTSSLTKLSWPPATGNELPI